MSYRVDISSIAKAEADAAFMSFSKYSTAEQAQKWYQGLIKAIRSLQTMPHRCVIARENNFFSQEIRQLLYGKGQHTYRILFTVLDEPTQSTVRVLHVRNAAQRTLGEVDKME